MSVEKLSAAASQIAVALATLEPGERKKAIDVALMLCPETAVAPPKKRRSDAGTTRRKADRGDGRDDNGKQTEPGL